MSAKFDEANKFFAHLSGGPVLHIKFEFNIGMLLSGIMACLDQKKNVPIEIRIFNSIDDSEDRIISNLAHEYVHAKQFWEGRLKIEEDPEDKNHAFSLWNKKEIIEMHKSRPHEEYLNWPWEVEARQLSREWVIQFNRFWRELNCSK